MDIVQVVIRVSNLQKLSSFYEAVLKPLGISIVGKSDNGTCITLGPRDQNYSLPLWMAGRRAPCIILVDANSPMRFGEDEKTEIGDDEKIQMGNADGGEIDLGRLEAAVSTAPGLTRGGESTISRDIVLHFEATSRQKVDEFQELATAAGAKITVPAAYRPKRGRFYYGATIKDADGRTIEVASTDPRFMWLFRLVFWTCYILYLIRSVRSMEFRVSHDKDKPE